MRTIKISKGKGKPPRIVVAPSRSIKDACRAELPRLEAIAMTLDIYGVQHGFTPGRSPVTAAQIHTGFAHTIQWDLRDCFDHVLESRVASDVPIHGVCWVDGVAKQGLPTSPAIANIDLAELDAEIVRLLNGRGVYTRYGDDLAVSSDDLAVIKECARIVPRLIVDAGHEVATEKTTLQHTRAGRRQILGLSVDQDVRPSRFTKRKLRAARHRLRTLIIDAVECPPEMLDHWAAAITVQVAIVTGLIGWASCNRPNVIRSALKQDHPLLPGMMVRR